MAKKRNVVHEELEHAIRREANAEVPGREAEEGVPGQPLSGVRDDEQARGDEGQQGDQKGPSDGEKARRKYEEEVELWGAIVGGIRYRLIDRPIGYSHLRGLALQRYLGMQNTLDIWEDLWRS